MKKIILERNIEYADWENIIYTLLFVVALFVGTTFFSSGAIAHTLSITSAIAIIACLILLLIKKGLVVNEKLFHGYFLFGKLFFKREIKNPASDKFTMMSKKYRQKYIRSSREQNWEYSVDSFELYFFDEDGAIRDRIVKCMRRDNCERAKDFLVKNYSLKFVSIN